MSQNQSHNSSFQSILEEKLGVLNEKESRKAGLKNENVAQETLISTLLKTFSKRSSTTSVAKIYPYKKPKPRPWDPSGLSPSVRLAFEYFHLLGAENLTQDSSLSDLKSSFRKLAKQVHPDAHAQKSDQTKQNQKFRELHSHYKTLCYFLQK